MDKLHEEIMTPLSAFEVLNKINRKVKYHTYPEIMNMKTMNDLLGKEKACILLYLTSKHYGHWTCVYEHNGKIYFFDSYGLIPDNELKFNDKAINKQLKQCYRKLTELFYQSGKPIEYNEHELQYKGKGISTCGRWCVVRLNYPDISVNNFAKLFKDKNLTPDEIITLLTI